MYEEIADPDIIAGYLTDASNIRGHAECLVRPRNTEEVAAVIKHCQENEIPLTITAARTSTTAGPVPFGGWLLSTEYLTSIQFIKDDVARAQAGINLGAFQEEIESKGRFYPPDPTSRHDCTLGASIACNASGARTFRYGATREWIEAIQVVLPTGEICEIHHTDPIPPDWPVPQWTEPKVKTAAGYSPPKHLLDLFIGQEGTLGLITEATVRVTALPTNVMGLIAFFPSRHSAVKCVETLRDAARKDPNGALSPRCIEYLDVHCLDIVRSRVGTTPDGAHAALFCEQEISEEVGDEAHLEAWWSCLEAVGALADDTFMAMDDPSRKTLHEMRHAIPAEVNERVVRNRMPKVGTDFSVPDEALSILMERYEQAPLDHILFGHIGDNHLHLNILPKNDEELTTARAFVQQLAEQVLSLGGSISAEHGIGKTKKHYLEMMVGSDTIQQFRALKAHLDPGNILGRGTLFDS